MLAQQVAKKYSRAIFELAKEKNMVDQAWEQFQALAEYLKEDDSFLDFMTAPQIADDKKLDLVKRAFEGQLETAFYDFLMVLVEKRRIRFLPEILEELDSLIREDKGITRATCITADPISDDERNKLIAQLREKTNQQIELVEKTDKGVIGGMVVMMQNQIIDGSIRHGLNQLRNRLMRLKVH